MSELLAAAGWGIDPGGQRPTTTDVIPTRVQRLLRWWRLLRCSSPRNDAPRGGV